MKMLRRMLPLLSAVAICSITSIAWSQPLQPQPAPSPLIAAGSGVNLEITRLLAKDFMKDHPQVTIEVPGSIGTKGAIKAIADGAITSA